jgi:hypothetical protein
MPQSLLTGQLTEKPTLQLGVLPFIFSGTFTFRAICRASTCDLKQFKRSNASGQKLQKDKTVGKQKLNTVNIRQIFKWHGGFKV